jgi:hypothetical protein
MSWVKRSWLQLQVLLSGSTVAFNNRGLERLVRYDRAFVDPAQHQPHHFFGGAAGDLAD